MRGTVAIRKDLATLAESGSYLLAGGFIAALERGLSIVDASRFANAVGALAVQKIGATAGVLDWNATMRWMPRESPTPGPSA